MSSGIKIENGPGDSRSHEVAATEDIIETELHIHENCPLTIQLITEYTEVGEKTCRDPFNIYRTWINRNHQPVVAIQETSPRPSLLGLDRRLRAHSTSMSECFPNCHLVHPTLLVSFTFTYQVYARASVPPIAPVPAAAPVERHGPTPKSQTSSPMPRSPARLPNPADQTLSPTAAATPALLKDFSFLLRPEIYHPLTPLTVPAPFRTSQKQPAPETPIPKLLAGGHFRAAAIAAAQELTSAPAAAATAFAHPPVAPTDHARIFALLHTRLLSLTLMDATDIAAQEARALEDLAAPFYYDDLTGEHLAPWELRVLAVRLQAMGFGDPRRAVMGYYELAREARAKVAATAKNHDLSGRETWKARLQNLGVRVAGALVEMDDLGGGAAHLSTLKDGGDGRLSVSKALLWLQLGDVDAARACVEGGSAGHLAEGVIMGLSEMADGNYEAALELWADLKSEIDEKSLDDEMIAVNKAVCLLYLGRMEECRDVLEALVGSGHRSRALFFNLATIYELSTDKAKALKLRLAERAASMEEDAKGWEKANNDFKL
ncbi:hypothetical protein MKZ38_001700 [Zalerion maritima]|uniref:Tetratricopeptide repeat protein 15 n=1 Tax=Zalerion maritima TaxID=339359 RepID=A0AAD5RXP9_9PEZI|nr:hypothetical protein MKZ38_001700 [Zalerion maritima]